MVDVHEHEDGSVVIRYAGEVLPATAFRKDGHVTLQDIESNKYLGRALAQIREAQVAPDRAAFHGPKMTLRKKRRLTETCMSEGIPVRLAGTLTSSTLNCCDARS